MNAGSSSLKFSLFCCQENLKLLYRGEVERILDAPCLTIVNQHHTEILKKPIEVRGIAAGLHAFFKWFAQAPDNMRLKVVGHRMEDRILRIPPGWMMMC